uniref:histone acetyltransferase n=1 Tax=Ascaris lumbricoides TaxID=6252 RepID=A0A0M3I398_ASCLU
MGTPERPLSDLGRISYSNYWLSAIFEHLHHSLDPNNPDKIIIQVAAAVEMNVVLPLKLIGSSQIIEEGEIVMTMEWRFRTFEWTAKEYKPCSPTKDSTLCSRGASSSNSSHNKSPPASESEYLRDSSSD